MNVQLTGFDPQEVSENRLAGPCQVGGRPAHAEFERTPAGASVTVLFGGEPGPLPPYAAGIRWLSIDGADVAVDPAGTESGHAALSGAIDAALFEALVPAPAPAGDPAPSDAPAPAETLPAAPSADPGADALVDASRRLAEAKAERATHAARVEALRAEEAGLRSRLEAVEQEIANADAGAADHADRCNQLRQRIRDLLDAEEA